MKTALQGVRIGLGALALGTGLAAQAVAAGDGASNERKQAKR
jgi:hypothetical protein